MRKLCIMSVVLSLLALVGCESPGDYYGYGYYAEPAGYYHPYYPYGYSSFYYSGFYGGHAHHHHGGGGCHH